jgi:hypothetical protein
MFWNKGAIGPFERLRIRGFPNDIRINY